MEELQARIRAIRTLQTEMNLAKQPYPEPDSSEEGDVQDGSKVVEMRDRSPIPGEVAENGAGQRSSSRRKSQTSSKRKTQATPAKQKAFVPFHQLREGNQQPYVDELRRLEAQAERINQLLAERAEKKAQLEPAAEPTGDRGKVTKSGRADRSASTKTPTTGSKKSTAKRSQQVHQPYGGGEVLPMSEFNDPETESLKAQADRINQLLAELEATIRQGGAIVDPPRPDSPIEPPPATPYSDFESPTSGLLSYPSEAIPSPNGQNRVPFDPNLKQKVQEAAETAQALRHLANRERFAPPNGPYENVVRPRSKRSSLNPIRRLGLRLRQFLQVPQKPMDQLGDAVLWIVLSAVVRVGVRFLIMLYPAISPVVTILMFIPPALAVYLAVFVPRAGFVSVYRLFLITLGLLLGGKF
jgi:hypothetical protein